MKKLICVLLCMSAASANAFDFGSIINEVADQVSKSVDVDNVVPQVSSLKQTNYETATNTAYKAYKRPTKIFENQKDWCKSLDTNSKCQRALKLEYCTGDLVTERPIFVIKETAEYCITESAAYKEFSEIDPVTVEKKVEKYYSIARLSLFETRNDGLVRLTEAKYETYASQKPIPQFKSAERSDQHWQKLHDDEYKKLQKKFESQI